MTHLSMNSRIVDWLHRQPDLIQAIVLGAFPKHLEKELAMVIFRQMSGEPPSARVKEILSKLQTEDLQPAPQKYSRKRQPEE